MSLKLIPVVDLLHGTVVRAVKGERASYRPIVSALCPGSAPLSIVGALLEHHPFTALYLADLDAIQRQGDNLAAIEAIRRAFPMLSLWVDAGVADEAALAAWQARGLGRAVVGSETLAASAFPSGFAGSGSLVLSLDFRGDQFVGPAALLEDAARWPQEIIAMTLARVGSGQGPDLERLRALVARAAGRAVLAAGGVRDAGDLAALADCGAAGVLLASALHDRRLAPADIARYG